MKRTEIILVVCSIVGIALSLSLLPGGNMLSIVAMGLLSCFYFYFGFPLLNGIRGRELFKRSAYKGINALKIVGGIGVGMLLSIIVIGFLFKLMMWPGGSFMIFISSIPIIIIGVIAGVRIGSSESAFSKRLLIRAVIFGGLGIIYFLLPSNSILKLKYRNYPEYVKAVEAASADPDNEALQEKANEELKKIEEGSGK